MKIQKIILVVEDEKSLREAIVDILRRKNYNPIEAKNGREGVDIALSKHPDLILLDLIMPEMDGMTALKKIRQNVWGAKVPIIILSNLSISKKQLAVDVAKYKPIFYFIKSDWKIHDIVDKVEKILVTNPI